MSFATNGSPIRWVGRWITVAAILGATSAAAADVGLPDTVLRIEASNAAGSGSVDVSLDSLSWDAATQSLSWEEASGISIVEPETRAVIATFDSVVLAFRDCSAVALEFDLEAGASETTVVFRTGQLSFGSIGSDVAEGRATAAFSLTDLYGDGAQMVGLGGAGMGAYRAYFNGAAPDGTLFAHLVALISVSGGTGSASQREPTFGYRDMGSEVSDMSVEIAFTLTAHDRLTASTTFDIDPDPADCGDDADDDGLPDWLDGCPDDPEKIEPGDCGCGVADADSDDDGIADCVDNCPETANPDQEDADDDGVGDACEEDGGDYDGYSDADDDDAEPLGDPASEGETADEESDDPGDADDGPPWGPGWAGLFGFAPAEGAEGDEALDEWMYGFGHLCGFGAAGLLPLTLLGLGGCKVVSYRRLKGR